MLNGIGHGWLGSSSRRVSHRATRSVSAGMGTDYLPSDFLISVGTKVGPKRRWAAGQPGCR